MTEETDKKTDRLLERVGKYQILGHIATGGMGEVYKARDADLDRVVALKILRPDLAKEEKIRVRFRREAMASAQLRHENIVAIYDVGECDGTYFLALEYVDGTDLEEYIERNGRLVPEQARQILIQAVRALGHAHEQRIVHRDIKPSNFLLAFKDERVMVKLTDFGLALRSEDDERQFRITKDGTTVGTVDYMSPEQARDSQSVDIRSDLYSLGCTFFHMLGGSAPFAQGSMPERLILHMQKSPPDVRRLNKAVPEGFVVIIHRMLAKKPEDRYQTPADLLKDLENYEQLPSPPPPSKRAVTEAVAPKAQKATTPRSVDGDATVVLKDLDVPKAAVQAKSAKPERAKKESDDTIQMAARPTAKRPKKPKKTPQPDRESDDKKARTDGAIAKREEEPTPEPKPKKSGKSKQSWMTYAPLGVIGALVLLVLMAMMFGGRQPQAKKKDPVKKDITPVVIIQEPKNDPPPVLVDTSPAKMTVEPLAFPAMTALPVKVDRTALVQEYAGPFLSFPRAPDGATMLELRRLAVTGGKVCRTLAEAFGQAQPNAWTVIEIFDDGPLYIPALPALTQCSVILRGAAGYRPLLAWEVSKTLEKVKPLSTWMSVANGKLVLENLDVVVNWSNEQPATAIDLQDADFYARDCTFSSAGKSPQGLTLLRRREFKKDAPANAVAQTWLRRCFVRGADVTLLGVSGGSAAVFLDESLVVGQNQPLLNVRQRDDELLQWHAIRSTMIAGNVALRWQSAAGKKGTPQISARILDSIVARDDPTAPLGDMLHLAGGAEPAKIDWKAANSVYAGWKKLLSADVRNIDGGDLEAWHREWHYSQGDRALVDCWPSNPPARLEESPAGIFSLAVEAPVAFSALTGSGAIGSATGRLSDAPAGWGERIFDPPPVPLGVTTSNDAPPEIDAASDGLYHGEKLDLNKVEDLGAYVQSVLQKTKPAPRVVFRISGSGTRLTSSMRIKGVKNLVLYFEPAKDARAGLKLGANPTSIAQRGPLIDVVDGNLELIGARIELSPITLVPTIVKMRRGDLTLRRCWLQGPLTKSAEGFNAVISVGSEGEGADAAPVTLTMRDCVVLSGKLLVRLKDQVHWKARNNAFVSLGDGVLYEAAGPTGPLLHLLDHNTWAVRQTTFATHMPPGLATPAPLVLYANCNAFLNPFLDDGSQSVLLRGAAEAVAKGGWSWRGRFNVYDARLHAYFAPWEKSTRVKQSLKDWKAVWGAVGEQGSLLLEAGPIGKTSITVETAATTLLGQLDRLALPRLLRGDPTQTPPGADLVALRIFGKKG